MDAVLEALKDCQLLDAPPKDARPIEMEYTNDFAANNLRREAIEILKCQPHNTEAARLLRELISIKMEKSIVDVMEIYRQPQWKKLSDMRGPIEGVELMHCKKCERISPLFMINGFLDLTVKFCTSCEKTVFKNMYDTSSGPHKCSCGGHFRCPSKINCVYCGDNSLYEVKKSSGYRYFMNHVYENLGG